MPEAYSSNSAFHDYERKRQEVKTRQPASRNAEEPQGIACIKCEAANSREHRFCRQCGSILWKNCSNCKSERPIDEAFCAACGTDIGAAEARQVESLRKQLADAQDLIEQADLNQALHVLNFIASQTHPGLEEIRTSAQQLVPTVTAQRDRYEEQATIHAERAEVLLEELRFVEAVQELTQIPSPLRDRQARSLLERATGTLQEIEDSKQRLRQPTGIAFAERMRTIDRLLELQPHDPQIARWSEKIHDHVMRAASEKLKSHDYAGAVELLRNIPGRLASDKLRKLQRHAEELNYLELESRLAPTVNSVSVKAVQRLVRLDQANEPARKRLREMTTRYQAAKVAADRGPAQWTACPDTTHVGLPVEVANEPQRLRFANPQVRVQFRKHPAQFHVACGLALQALGRAEVATNLMPQVKQKVLGRLKVGLRARPVTSAWGLDLSNTSLKAVQLTVNGEGLVEISKCFHHAHRQSLSHPDALGAHRAILLETLQQFTSEQSIESTDRVATQWPSVHSLLRCLDIPPAEGKQYLELLQREAQHQIPFALPDVCWDTFRFRSGDKNRKNALSQVLLVVARANDLTERLKLFQESGIAVQTIQCDALALHNFLHFDVHQGSEHQGSGNRDTKHRADSAPGDASTGLAVLDVGSDTTGIVFSYPDFVWFRAVCPAGDDLTDALIRRFKSTREVAEQVIRDPTKIKRMSDLHEELCVMGQKLVRQFESVKNDVEKLAPHVTTERLEVAGGAGQTHGLVRFLRFGR